MNAKRGDIKLKIMNSLMKDREAQFFLIAAVVIIVVVVSIVTISNYTEKRDVVQLYNLGQELGIESKNVLDYGTYSELNEEQMKVLMESFIRNYVNYLGNDKNIYFVFGNKNKINLAGYQAIAAEDVCVKTVTLQGVSSCNPYLTVGQTQEFLPTSGEIDKVVIKIGKPGEETEYEFALSAGENFYFVIWMNIGGEKYVINSS